MFSFGLPDAQAAPKKALPLPPPSDTVLTDEDIQKRNADCIYFLASPLTCKKGTNCEYRHSEAARMNPRDCRFWKAGNCLNPRCSFRHLPLDGKPPLATSIASTSSTQIVPRPVPATSSSNKFQTPCYFFSQGYCAKKDKCPFMHDSSAAMGGSGALQKSPAAELNGRAACSNEGPSITLKQDTSINRRHVASNGSHTVFKVPITSCEMPQSVSGIEKSKPSESNENSATSGTSYNLRKPMVQIDRSHDMEHSQLRQQTFQDKGKGMFAQPVDLRHFRNFRQGNAFGEEQSAVRSDNHEVTKSQSKLVGSNGQDSREQSRSDDLQEFPKKVPQSQALRNSSHHTSSKYESDLKITSDERAWKCREQKTSSEKKDSSSDLRDLLMKRRKQSSTATVSQKSEVTGQTGTGARGNGRKRPTEDPHVHQQQEKVLAIAVNGEGKAAKFDVNESSMPLQRVSLNRTLNTDKCRTQDKNFHEAAGGTSKREAPTFTGPKTLAQIKAEKMASISKVLGKEKLITEIGTNAASRKLETHAHTSIGKHENALMSTGSTFTSAYSKEKTTTAVEFDAPKPLSILLKRKRELDSDSDVSNATPVPPEAEVPLPLKADLSMQLKAEVSVPDTSGELEDGEMGDDSIGSRQESLPLSACPSKEFEVLLQRSSNGLQRARVELSEYEMESLEDDLKSDAEMEDIGYDDAGCEIDEDDDDDDFAKKLGRIFAFSNN